MTIALKEMLAAARAAVPALSLQEAADLAGRDDVLTVDVRRPAIARGHAGR